MAIDAVVMGLGLGMDATSVSAAIGVKWNGPRQHFRLAWHMGLFQFIMPVIGFALAKPLSLVFTALDTYGAYGAAILVFGLGLKMLYEVLRAEPGAVETRMVGNDPTRGWSLIALSVATSLDALIIGFSLALTKMADEPDCWSHLFMDAAIIGVVAGTMSMIGVNIGKRMGDRFGRAAELAGALVLMGLGVSFLVW